MKSKNNKNSYFKKLKKHHVKKIKLFKKAWKDSKGNISIVAAALILISFLILSIIILNVSLDEIHSNEEAISSNQYEYILKDYRRNIPLLEREALEELSEEVIRKKTPCTDSKEDLKKIIDEKLKAENDEYYKDYGIRIESHVSSIENSSNPFAVKIKTYISSVKGDLSYRNILEDDVSVEGLRDPVPILICGKDPSFKYNESAVEYGYSLSNYLKDNGIENYSCYINATVPNIVKKCPYDPYKHHGDGYAMKNCRDNGYYHESRDGACYMCRLEAKAGCEHYGFETFIIPHPTNETNLSSACGSDHVIFSDDIYPGVEVSYYDENGMNEILFLDPNGHRVKYGMTNHTI